MNHSVLTHLSYQLNEGNSLLIVNINSRLSLTQQMHDM